MAWMLGKDGKMVFVEPGTPVYGEIPAPLAMNIVNPQDGQALVYDGTKGEWVNGGSFDPTITNPQDGDTLVYDATAGVWKNGEGGGGGGGAMIVPTFTPTSQTTATCDMTMQEILEAVDAKQCLFARAVNSDGYAFFPVIGYKNEPDDKFIQFGNISVSNAGVFSMSILYENDNILLGQQMYPNE